MSTSIDRHADEVYAYVTDPANLSMWAAGLADSPLRQVEGKWVADSPLGRVTVAFVGPNDFGDGAVLASFVVGLDDALWRRHFEVPAEEVQAIAKPEAVCGAST